jgi:multiple sugar transport system substrate-binding protein
MQFPKTTRWLLIAVFLLAGCRAHPGLTPPSPRPLPAETPAALASAPPLLIASGDVVTITFGCWMSRSYEALAETFHQAHPYIHIDVIHFSELQDPNSDNSLDLQRVAASVDTAAWNIKPDETPAGWVRDLSPFVQMAPDFDTADFYPGMLEAFQWDGGLWALPSRADAHILFYNRDAFDEAGLPYPQPGWDQESFLSAAASLTRQENGEVTRYGFVDALGPLYTPFVHAAVGSTSAWDTVDLQDPTIETALRWYVDLAIRHRVMPTPSPGLSGPNSEAVWVQQGRAAMWTDFLSNRHLTGAGIVPFPFGERDANPFWVSGYIMSTGTQHPQESWLWLAFLTRQRVMDDRGRQVALIPARRSVAETSDYWAQWSEVDAAVLRYALDHPLVVRDDAVTSRLAEARDAVFAGTAAPVALAQAQQALRTDLAARAQVTPQPFSQAPPGIVPDSGRPVITFAPAGSDSAFYKQVAHAFNAQHSGTHVDVVTPQEWATADCFIGPSNSILDTSRRDVLNLAPLLDAQSFLDLADFAFVESFRKQGDLYGLPAYAPAAILRYDPAAFDLHDLAYPAPGWSLDEFLTTARALSQGEGPSRRYGFVSVLGEATTLPIFIAAQGADLWDMTGRPRFDQPDIVDAVRWYAELGRSHRVMPVLPGEPGASSAHDADQRRALVADGRAAMWMTLVGLGHPATETTAGGEEAGMAPVPGAQRTLFLPHGFFIAADSPHAAACWDWCVYAATHPAHPNLGVPAYKPTLLSEAFVAQATPDVVATYRALLDYDNLSQPPGAGPQYQALLDALADIYAGADIQAALEESQRAASRP